MATTKPIQELESRSSLESAPQNLKPNADITSDKEEEQEDDFPTDWRKITLIMVAIYLCMFLVALDRTILGTAIPTITNEFHSINDVGWYGSAYLLTSCAFQLFYARIYGFYSVKWVLLGAILIFETGSAVCGAAPSSTAFIVGRAIAGLGAAGIFSGCLMIMVITIPLHKRPMYQGIFGAIFGVASTVGPLMGGAFTTNASWRWCFYVNLPIGAVVVLIILFILEAKPSKNKSTTRERIMQLDPYGTVVFLPGVICLLLAMQWGGTTYAWSNARIIALFILAGLLLLTFVIIQIKSGDNATIPIRILKQRSIVSAAYFSFIVPGSMFTIIYFLPIWFQAIKSVDAEQSGINLLPVVLALVVASIMAGGITQKSGYYVPQIIACSVIMSIGTGLLTTLKVDTPSPVWIGYSILFGFGLGMGMQQAGMAAQTCLDKKDVTMGVSLMFFLQGLGGTVFLTIGQIIFTNRLINNLSVVSNLDPKLIVNSGATELKTLVPAAILDQVLVAYNKALTDTFKVAVGCAVATIITGLTLEWKSIKGLNQGSQDAEKKKKEQKKDEESGVTEESAQKVDEKLNS